MNLTFKKITVPTSTELKQLEAVQLWEVRWYSRYGEYFANTRPEVEAFTTKELADEFALALKQAFKLIRHTYGNIVTVKNIPTEGAKND